ISVLVYIIHRNNSIMNVEREYVNYELKVPLLILDVNRYRAFKKEYGQCHQSDSEGVLIEARSALLLSELRHSNTLEFEFGDNVYTDELITLYGNKDECLETAIKILEEIAKKSETAKLTDEEDMNFWNYYLMFKCSVVEEKLWYTGKKFYFSQHFYENAIPSFTSRVLVSDYDSSLYEKLNTFPATDDKENEGILYLKLSSNFLEEVRKELFVNQDLINPDNEEYMDEVDYLLELLENVDDKYII